MSKIVVFLSISVCFACNASIMMEILEICTAATFVTGVFVANVILGMLVYWNVPIVGLYYAKSVQISQNGESVKIVEFKLVQTLKTNAALSVVFQETHVEIVMQGFVVSAKMTVYKIRFVGIVELGSKKEIHNKTN